MNRQGKKINGILYINLDLLLVKLGFKHYYLILMKIKSLNKLSKFWFQAKNGFHIKQMKQFCNKK